MHAYTQQKRIFNRSMMFGGAASLILWLTVRIIFDGNGPIDFFEGFFLGAGIALSAGSFVKAWCDSRKIV